MVAVGLLFAPLAPLVVVEAAVVFWISSFVYKYQLMFVYVSKVESGGVRVNLDPLSLHVDGNCLAAPLERRSQSFAMDSCVHATAHDTK